MSVRIGMGMAAFPFSSARRFWRWVELCEDSDVDSIWQTDRLVSAQPQLEPLSLMAALAGGTRRLKFGMNVVVLGFRDPLVLAKQCATIDLLSEGRLLPAFGVGADRSPEWEAMGLSPAGRGGRADEALQIMARLWAGERVTFEGNHYRYRDAQISPTPVQRPLPLWIGGMSRAAVLRTARLGTGWLGGTRAASEVAPVVAAIKREALAAGRVIDPDHYGVGFAYRFGEWDEPIVQRAAQGASQLATGGDPRELMAVGDAETIRRRIEAYCAAGVSKFVLRPLAVGDDEVMDQTRRLIETVVPVVHGMVAPAAD